ncbi:hypothetical protein MKEN_00800000 [Mycena kentingensis (nom. inval.)]|nr:hypothetical protein MKEN_00800000 [Mycena kentingensis (nom. inval.)]
MSVLGCYRRLPRQLFSSARRWNSYEHRYADKIKHLAQQRGVSVAELKAQVKQERAKELRERQDVETASSEGGRKDSSPVKPLATFLNLSRIFATPHTAEQISALWTVYHASRSNGTGRGYLCASIPLGLYTKMASIGAQYPMFVVPLRRPSSEPASGEQDAHEFYFLQWSFHESPPTPSATDDLFFAPSPPSSSANLTPNPPTSTVMFTPLQEYKSRATFATPYMVLTNYTDLAQSHGIVLVRGEITPAGAGAVPGAPSADERYLLPQEDAIRLSQAVQNFYLDASSERKTLLKAFHETPTEFQWKELLKHAV